MKKETFKDTDLLAFAKCNLLDEPALSNVEIAARRTAKLILLKKSENLEITKLLITNTFEKEFQLLQKEGIKDGTYWAGIKSGRRFISKLYWLMTKYEVLQPEQSYQFIFPNGNTISGEYGIIQKRTGSEKPLVLVFAYNRPIYFDKPNVSSCAKWLHSKTNYLNIGIYNFSLFRGDDWKELNLDYQLINDWVYAILKQVYTGFTYINPGNHCSTCVSKKCLEVYNG